jgi:hypothetical protein
MESELEVAAGDIRSSLCVEVEQQEEPWDGFKTNFVK